MARDFFIFAYVFFLLVADPHYVLAFSMARDAGARAARLDSGGIVDPFFGAGDEGEIRLAYALNGGENSPENPALVQRDELPVTLALPEREGYNFAGWYTDSSYRDKVTEINDENARNMMLFAKWTREIDSEYSVEMYPYMGARALSGNQKELKDCSYGFLEDVKIPGMPSTRERDYMDNEIASERLCMQGICFTPDLLLLSAYSEEDDLPGALMVFSRDTGEYLLTLKMRESSHVGGIAFDGEGVWVCHSDSRSLERVPYEFLLEVSSAAGRAAGRQGQSASEKGGLDAPSAAGGGAGARTVDAAAFSSEYRVKNTPSSITCYGGRIWVATHDRLRNSEMVSYCFDEREGTLTAMSSYSIPSKVQGVAFDQRGAVYLSTSYGRNKSSYLKVYSSLLALGRDPGRPAAKVEMPPCAEEIAVVSGDVYVLFESASRKYFEGTDGNGTSSAPIDKVLKVDASSIW